MKKLFSKKRKRILFLIAILYVAGGAVIYFFQDNIIFQSEKIHRNKKYQTEQPAKEIFIPINQTDSLHLMQFYRNDTTQTAKGLVLFYHGNKTNISHYSHYAPLFTKYGYDVIMLDYPNYGKSRGKITEDKLYAWSKEAYAFASQFYPPENIIIYGKSLGTGLAAHIASIRGCKRLFLETPYYDFPAVFKRYAPIYPIDWLLKYELPTHQYLQQVSAPVTIFHGTKDGVVSYKNAKRLSKYLKPSDELVTIKGGSHNNLPEYDIMIQKLDSLLSK